MCNRILSCLLLLAASLHAGAADLYSEINRLRAGKSCAAAGAPPLKRHEALERVARDLAQGKANLKDSMAANGYRAARSRAFNISGPGAPSQAPVSLAKPEYCAQLADDKMTEAGVYSDPGQVWIVIASPFAVSMGMPEAAAGQRVLELVNQARAQPRTCGERSFGAAGPVTWNGKLAAASKAHSEDMARHSYFAHNGLDGTQPAKRVERAGYRFRITGENIAAGAEMKPENAVDGWIRSPPHCANLMNPRYTEMGAGFSINPESKMGVYWTQVFGLPR